MIARAKSVKGSKAASLYKEQDNKNSIVVVQEHINGFTAEERWEEMKSIAQLNTRTQKPIVENVLSPIKEVGDKMTLHDWKQLAIDYADKMGYRENQWYAVLHQNTDERHLHIAVNRIDFNGKNTINDHRIGERAGQIADKLAKERGLKTAKELTKEKTNKIAEVIRTESRTATSWEQFQERMKSQGFEFQLNYNSKGLNGARVIPADQVKTNKSRREELSKSGYTLSKIDRKLKVHDLQALFERNKEIKQQESQSQEEERRKSRLRF